MKNLFERFIKDESGATMVEYAILVALLSIVAIVVIGEVGEQVQANFQQVADDITPTP